MFVEDVLSKIIELNSDEEVDQFILSGGRVLYFTAPWCNPCKIFAPRIAKVANDTGTVVGRINADLVAESIKRYNVRSIPTMVKVNLEGDLVAYERGIRDEDFIKTFLSTSS